MTPTSMLRLASRNTARHRVRTALTVGMVVFGVALLIIAITWLQGVMGGTLESATGVGGHVRLVVPEYAEREELMPLYANVPEVEPLVKLLESQPGVVAVEPRITTGVTVTVGQELGDVFALVAGANDRYFRERLDVRDRLIAGHWFTGAPDELVAGARVASQAGAKIGDELLLLGVTQDGSLSPIKGHLVGIVKAGNPLVDQQVLVPLDKVRWLADVPHGATELLIYGQSYESADALAKRLRAVPGLERYRIESWSEREPWRSLMATLKGVQNTIVFTIVFLTALGIWNTMMMSVLERTHEIGVLRAMGLSRLGTIALFQAEALAIAVVGGVLGVGLGFGPAWLLQKYGIRIGEKTVANLNLPYSEVMHGRLSGGVLAAGFGLGLLMALLGSLIPAMRAAGVQPVSAMRTGR